jgi:hypothetical protein
MQKILKHWPFIVLILLGLVLRAVFMAEQGLSNDELSALCRTRADSWSSFWNEGVKYGDMHPVFYQALLWVWVRLFGESEFFFRLPSLLFYVINSWLIYRIALRYFSQFAGLAITALYASLTFTIINTVFARPYNSGTFFLLVLVSAILELKWTEQHNWKFVILMTIGFLGAMLSHYFAFIVAFSVGLTGLFYLGKKTAKFLIVSGIFSIILFLPHLPVTLYQVGRGGLEWLAAPGITWPFDFIKLFFNSSWVVVTTILIIYLILLIRFGIRKMSKEGWYLLSVFLFSFISAYIISYAFTPVLRELVMLFMLPFLLLPLFDLVKIEVSQKVNILIVALAVLISVDSLWRNELLEPVHFGVFKEVGKKINEDEALYGAANITYASNYNSVEYINYYLRHDLEEPIVDWQNPEALFLLKNRAKNASAHYFCYSFNNSYSTPMFLEVIRKYYPGLVRNYLTKFSSYYLFKKTGERIPQKPFFKKKTIDSLLCHSEFFGNCKLGIGEFPTNHEEKEYYLVKCKGKLTKRAPFFIVASLERNGKILLNQMDQPVFYSAYDQSRLTDGLDNEEFFLAFELPSNIEKNDSIAIYFWNPERIGVQTGDMEVFLTQ